MQRHACDRAFQPAVIISLKTAQRCAGRVERCITMNTHASYAMTCDYATVHNVPLCAHAPHCDATAHCPTMADPFCQRCSEPPDGVLPCNGCSVYDPDFSIAKGTRPQCPHEAPLSSICTFNPSFPEVFDSFEKNFTHQPKIVSASVRFQIISPFL